MQNLSSEFKSPITSSKRKSVFLHQWWLIKVESETKLGVGGFVNKEPLEARGMRILGSPSTGKRRNTNTTEDEIQVFRSAAISKRHDNNTLETLDGIIIRISGYINKSRTMSYGFSPEVCDGFLSGFPFTWEDYVSKSSHDKVAYTTQQSLPESFDDLPITRVQDLLMSESESPVLTNIIFKDILKHTENILVQSVSPIEKVCKNSTETEADHKEDDVASLPNPTQKITEEDSRIPVDIQLETSKESKDGGFMLDEVQKITEEDSRIPVDIQLETSKESEDGSFMLDEVQKITEEDSRIPVDIQLETSKESKDGGFMLDEVPKITEEDSKIPVDIQLETSKESEDGGFKLDKVQKRTQEDSKISVDIQLKTSKESKDGGFMLDKVEKITRGKESKELRRIYPLRSMQKRKRTHEVKI